MKKMKTIDIIALSAHISAQYGAERSHRVVGGSASGVTWILSYQAGAVPGDMHYIIK